MVSIEAVTEWLAEHGYRDLYPRRDASEPDVLFYVFVREGRPRIGIRCQAGKVSNRYFQRIQQVVHDAEQDDPSGQAD
jgi:hypothetical protein